ncbi:alpha/beta hydrolase [Streptomyces sp. R21]|uniref:Alpha/beta hydrolase n=1 Tax=Streptomyces sp. R21 TaxID=3238627 RepID=A0AB39P6V9_9ACTN
MNRSSWTAAALVCAGVLVLGACGDDDSGGEAATTPAPSSTVKDFGCLAGKQLKGSVTFKDTEGNDVGGYETGTGTTGIVLSHMRGTDVCSWVPAADELAGDGYRVLAVDSSGSEVPEIEGATARLRAHGAKKIILMGASKGGTASLVAASKIAPKAAAVVSLSGPGLYNSMDATEAVPKLTMPVLFVAAKGDGQFADDAKEMDRLAKKSRGEKLQMVSGAAHGNGILDQQPSVWADVKAFLAKYR